MWGKGNLGTANPMFGKRSPRWNGGRKVRKDGYVLIWASSHYELEHRMIMENALGRKLLPTEVVHHIDENPGNNELSNLQLLPSQAAHMKIHSAR